MRPLKIGISWVRGVVGETLTPELLVDFACAFGTFVEGAPVVVGHDSRRSAPMLRAAVLSGLQSCGSEVWDLGLAPTPIVQFAVRSRRLAGGISLTASHNYARWNALKFVGREGLLLNSFQSEEVMDIYHLGEFLKRPWDLLGRVRPAGDVTARYLDFICSKLDLQAIGAAKFRVVVDCCNGAGAGVVPKFLERLGCRVIALHDVPDGDFPHPPEPSARNMRALASVVSSVGADVGFLVNVDVDRVGLVADGGAALSEEYVFPIIADHVLETTRGSVVTTLSTSRMVESVAAARGRAVVRARIGEGYVMQRVVAERAALGGEGSGGVAVPRAARWFDGFIAMGLVLEAMAHRGAPLSELAARLPRFVMLKGSIPSSSERIYPVLEAFRRQYRDQNPNLEDGVRVDWPDAWLHVRASNTEPLLRVIVEADDERRAQAVYDDAVEGIHRLAQGRGRE
jgi:phosphomannomutase